VPRNIYVGPSSCWGRAERVHVPARDGVDAAAASGILSLLDIELRRGWTFDHSCRRVPMTPELARRRALYLIALARKHRGPGEARRVAWLVHRWLRERGLLARVPEAVPAAAPAGRRRAVAVAA
jgi:hypothetical protein